MAELIPLQYRLRISQRMHIRRWTVTIALVLVLSLVSLAYMSMWSRQQASTYNTLAARYRDRSSLIVKSQQLRTQRQELASRMQQVQQLMDDKTLLLLLRKVSDEFGPSDCLQYVTIDARPQNQDKANAAIASPYKVRLIGTTANTTTLAELTTRLSRRSDSPMNAVLQSSKRQSTTDGQVMRFEIVCEKAPEKGT